MHARALYVAFDVYPRPKGSSSHIASMITALAREFAPVCVLCPGDADLPLHQNDGTVEIHRLPDTHRDVLRRAMLFAQFVEFHVGRHSRPARRAGVSGNFRSHRAADLGAGVFASRFRGERHAADFAPD